MPEKPTYEELEQRVRMFEEESVKGRMTGIALRERDEQYRQLFENARESIFVAQGGKLVFVNPMTAFLTGYSPEELQSRPFIEFIHPDDRGMVLDRHIKRMRGDSIPEVYSFRIINREGRIIWAELNAVLISWEGNPATLNFIRDITERRHTDRALFESETKFRAIFQYANDAIFLMDNDIFIDCNEKTLEMFGCTREQIIGQPPYRFSPAFQPDGRESAEKALEKISGALKGKAQFFEWKHCRYDGTVFDAEISLNELSAVGKNYIQAIVRDITDRKRSDEEILREREKFRILSDNAPFGMVLIDREGKFKYANRKFKELFGYDLDDIPDGREWFRKAFPDSEYRHTVISKWMEDFRDTSPGEKRPRVFKVACRDGNTKIISFISSLLTSGDFIVTFEDITQQKRVEMQLRQAQKLESIGTLAGGIAHDFNNLLMGIQGCASLMLLDLDPAHPHYEMARRIEEQVQSGSDLTRQLMGFARGGRYEVKPASMNDILRKTASIFGRTKKEITIHQKYSKELWNVEVDPSQIEQVFMNLYVNAWHAMPGGGEIFLETENVCLDDGQAFKYAVKIGRYVKITVTDTGEGMDAETRERIFDPFFTTKEMGRGVGLGLAMVYGIIKGHQGFINVYSEPGRGTTFGIFMPASEKEVEEEKIEAREIERGIETILIVDDEMMVLEVTRSMLESLGYRVYAFGSVQEALDLYAEKKDSIDLIVLDMIMPGISGGEAFDRFREIDPEVKVLLSSGYSVNGEARKILDRGCDGFIQKPFQLKKLAQIVRELLDKKI
ncbi:MAG: PAS domain S-box protein [Deltaproteobacteria bacterium]|nr:PAS domain S-box protein [Deltaproteobacteria bacterium]